MKRERPASGRCSEVVRGCEAEWSATEAKRRSQANLRRQSACAGAWAKWKPSLAGCEPHLPPEKRSWSAGIVRQSAQSADGSGTVVPPLQGL